MIFLQTVPILVNTIHPPQMDTVPENSEALQNEREDQTLEQFYASCSIEIDMNHNSFDSLG